MSEARTFNGVPVLHVGCNHTGTTYLQNVIFDGHPEIINVGKPRFDFSDVFLKATTEIKESSATSFDSEHHRRAIDAMWTNLLDDGRVVVWSDENFSADKRRAEQSAKRLKGVVGQAKVLITIRSQYGALETLHASRIQKAAMGKIATVEKDMDAWISQEIENLEKGKPSDVGRMDYAHVVSVFSEAFGEENIHVMTLEHLRCDKVGYITELAAWIGVDVQWRPAEVHNDRQVSARQRISRRRLFLLPMARHDVFQRMWRALPDGIKGEIRQILDGKKGRSTEMTEKTRALVQGFFAEGNAKIAQRYDLPLEKYGYPL